MPVPMVPDYHVIMFLEPSVNAENAVKIWVAFGLLSLIQSTQKAHQTNPNTCSRPPHSFLLGAKHINIDPCDHPPHLFSAGGDECEAVGPGPGHLPAGAPDADDAQAPPVRGFPGPGPPLRCAR